MKGDNEFALATPSFPHRFSRALQVLLVPPPGLNVRGRLFPSPSPAVLQQSCPLKMRILIMLFQNTKGHITFPFPFLPAGKLRAGAITE